MNRQAKQRTKEHSKSRRKHSASRPKSIYLSVLCARRSRVVVQTVAAMPHQYLPLPQAQLKRGFQPRRALRKYGTESGKFLTTDIMARNFNFAFKFFPKTWHF